jgi:hypothetical protein
MLTVCNNIRRPLDPDRPGDNIYAVIPAGDYLDYTIKIPDTLPRAFLLNRDGEGPGDIAHPGGLYWYHPHIHGIAGYQVRSGLSGVISIGDPFELMVPLQDGGNLPLAEWQVGRWREEQRARTDVRYIELRDVQLQVLESRKRPMTAVANHREFRDILEMSIAEVSVGASRRRCPSAFQRRLPQW